MIANRYYDEASTILENLRVDFPAETAIVKLLDSARGDKAEQLKQQKLTEARAHLASRSFSEALALLEELVAAHPKDAAILKLRALAKQEHEKQAKEGRIQRELDALKKLVSERNYQKVISRTKELLAEFPGETNFRRLAEFAASQQEIIEKDSVVQKALLEATALFNARQYKECAAAAEAGLRVSPGNIDLQKLHDDAELQQKKRVVHDRIEERVRQIRTKITREEFSEAISLAKETIRTIGTNTDINQLLSSAEVEFESRQRKNVQANTIDTIRTLIESGQIDAAGRALHKALETEAAQQSDPRIQALTARIEEAGTSHPMTPTATSVVPPAEAREYAFFQNAPIQPPPQPSSDALWGPSTAQGAATKRALSPTPNLSPKSEPPAAPILPPVQPQPVNSIDPSDVQVIPSKIYRKHAAGQRRPNLGKTIFAWALVVAVVSVAFFGYRAGLLPEIPNLPGKTSVTTAPVVPDSTTDLEAQQRALLADASELVAKNDLDGARQKLRAGAHLNGPLTEELTNRISEIDASKDDPQLRQLRQREESLWQKAQKNANNERYIEAQKDLMQILQLKPGGLHRQDAQTYLDKVVLQHLQEMDLLAQARLDLGDGEFESARAIAGQLSKNGSDTTKLVAEIDERERTQVLQLEKKYNELSQRDGEEVILQLNALWSKFNELSTAGGPMSGEALDYLNKIPETVVNLQARLKQKDADALFAKAVRDYQSAAKLSNKDGLVTAHENFQSISRAGGPHADDAAKLLEEVNKKLAVSNIAPPSSSPGGSPKNSRESDVRSAMQLYVKAFESRDVDALKQIWPSIGAQYEGFKLVFGDAKSIRMHMEIENMKFDPDGMNVVVTVKLLRELTGADSKTLHLNEQENFQLSKLSGSWTITDIDATF
ncbi:MAG: hypothetical protein JO260_02335 [Acidobacteria bacterium]|nr:hypothetical protein [Acidobacteriota bacterium]